MESKAKLLGHPIHPMLITFPIGLLTTSVIFDVIGLLVNQNNAGNWHNIAFYMIGAGLIGGLAAAIFGFVDWLGIPHGTRARSIGAVHGLGNLVVVVLFGLSFFMRANDSAAPGPLAVILSFAGILLATFTAWLGGELVDRLGVGVDRGAHLAAPNSLSGRPATENAHTHSVNVNQSGD
jgi:uncharacterized membrane protein